jgi:hypothetical protein
MSKASESRSPVAAKRALLSVAICLLVIGLVYAVLAGWDRGVPGLIDPDRRQAALRTIEYLGGEVPHEIALPDEYRLRLLDITLGSDWSGGNERLALFAAVGSVYELILDSPKIDDAGLAQLGSIELEGLTAKGTTITDVGLRHLERVRGLKMVRLDGSHITDAGLESLRVHDLKWLILENDSQVTDAGLAHLAEMTRLIWLELPGADLTGAGLAHLDQLDQLRTLVLAGTDVGDESLAHLSKLERLNRLDLSGTRVTGPGLPHLKGLDKLEELYLDDTELSDDDLPHLAELRNLVFLSLEGTTVTETGLQQLGSMSRLQTVLLDGKEWAVGSRESGVGSSGSRLLAPDS